MKRRIDIVLGTAAVIAFSALAPASPTQQREERKVACWRDEVKGTIVDGWKSTGLINGQFTLRADGDAEPRKWITTGEIEYLGKKRWGGRYPRDLAAGNRVRVMDSSCDPSKVVAYSEE